MSDIQKAIKVIQTEKSCVSRQQCDRDCSKCDLVMQVEDILSAYDAAIAALHEKHHNDELRQQGRLMELPCALGDTAYWISDVDEDGNEIDNIQKTGPIKGIVIKEDGLYIKTDSVMYDKVGSRYALLTLETAQKMLEKVEADQRE